MTDFLRSFRAARRVSTPLVAVRTPDPAASIRGVLASLQSEPEEAETPVLLWDVCNGLVGLNPLLGLLDRSALLIFLHGWCKTDKRFNDGIEEFLKAREDAQ